MQKLFKNMRIRTQLIMAFCFVAAITVIILIIGIMDMRNMAVTNEGLINRVILPLEYVRQSTQLMENIQSDGHGAILLENLAERNQKAQRMLEDISRVRESMAVFGETIVKEEAAVPYKNLMNALDEYINLMPSFHSLLQEDLTREIHLEKAVSYFDGTLVPLSEECIECLDTLNGVRLKLSDDLVKEAAEKSKTAFQSMVAFLVAGIFLIVIMVAYFSRSLTRPILKGVLAMQKAAEGDFSVMLPDEYGAEMGQFYRAFNALLEYNRLYLSAISKTSTQLRGSAQNMLSISGVMADNSKGLKEQTSLVSSSVEELSVGMMQSSHALSVASAHIGAVTTSIVEMNSMIGTVAAAAEETSTRVDQSNTLVDSIQSSISTASGSVGLVSDTFNSVAQSINEINSSIMVMNEHCGAAMSKVSDVDSKAKSTNLVIQQLETASKQIGKIVNIISDIADQTNILALNAAIEAAGAGEAGRGFMVVASEVKELARQTTDATDEIADRIENMQKNMSEAVGEVSKITENIHGLTQTVTSLVQEVTQQGKRSDQIAEESASAARRMNEISVEIGRISENALSVSRAVQESTKGVNEIASSTSDLALGTQEIAMNSEQASKNIQEIDRGAKDMSNGLIEISRNIQLIHVETGSVQNSANQTNKASEELLDAANAIEKLVTHFH